jgi:wyosine [tRNA(Phe)-imidazoG37] synthetase (radical SAM superfamily)
MAYRYVFGPVLSRRLGVSLGIDLVPLKTCTYDCIYCECGKTTNLTCERRAYVPTDRVLAELDEVLLKGPELDYITFAGSGEPTLHADIGDIITFVKQEHPQYTVAVLTGGALLSDPGVRRALLGADLVIPSLDAVSEDVFRQINRSCPSVTAERVLEGLIAFRQEFSGEMWLEIFIVPGLNDTESELTRLKDAITAIRPDRVQLNTLDRPGTECWVRPVSPASLERIASFLGGMVETVPAFCESGAPHTVTDEVTDALLATIRRRPCTMQDLAQVLNLRPTVVAKFLRALEREGKVEAVRGKRGIFYRAV